MNRDRLGMLAELIRLGDGEECPPTQRDMKDDGKYWPKQYWREFGSWTEALEAAGFDSDAVYRKVTDEELITDLHRVAKEVGGAPTSTEVHDLGKHAPKSYRNRCDGSWEDVVEWAGFDVEEYKQRKSSKLRTTTDEELLFDLRCGAVAIGHSPSVNEYNLCSPHGAPTLLRHFGSWEGALEAADLPPAGEPVDMGIEDIPTPEEIEP